MEENQPTTPKVKRGPLRTLLAVLGPGLFLIGYNIGTGSVTTMASAGSKYGMQLMWVVLLSCIFVFLGIILFGRYTLGTGETVLYAIKKHLPGGKAISLLIMVSLILGEFAGVAGMMALMVDILNEWIGGFCGCQFEYLPQTIAIAIAVFVFAILWNGAYAFLETFLAVLVGLMGFCFVITAFLVQEDGNHNH